MGFTSGTGAAFSDHDILSWRFDNVFAPIGGAAPSAAVPALADAALWLLAGLLAGAAWLELRQRRA